MVDSTLAGVELAALTQGVTFLYSQAGEILKRRRDAKDRAEQEAEQRAVSTDPDSPTPTADVVPLDAPPEVFVPVDDFGGTATTAVLDQLSADMLQARRNVEDYVLGTAALDPSSRATLEAVERLRRIMERVYGAPLTFQGEHRRHSVDSPTVHVDARTIGVMVAGNVEGGDVAHTMHKYTSAPPS